MDRSFGRRFLNFKVVSYTIDHKEHEGRVDIDVPSSSGSRVSPSSLPPIPPLGPLVTYLVRGNLYVWTWVETTAICCDILLQERNVSLLTTLKTQRPSTSCQMWILREGVDRPPSVGME